MDREVIACLEDVFRDVSSYYIDYHRNISICCLRIVKQWSFKEISDYYNLSITRVRAVFYKICSTIFYRLKSLRKGYHLPFHKKSDIGEVNYDVFRQPSNAYLFEELMRLAQRYTPEVRAA